MRLLDAVSLTLAPGPPDTRFATIGECAIDRLARNGNARARPRRRGAAGITVIRVTWRALVDEPLRTIVRIGQLLGPGGHRGRGAR